MAISEEIKSKILRYHHVEKWPVGTIARMLHVHHTTVKRVICHTVASKDEVLTRRSMIDPFIPFIHEQLGQYPKLAASRMYAMVVERGYQGGPDHFRHLISFYRPRKTPEAFLRLKTLPAEQAQVDWGHFGHITIGNARRPLMAFVMVLSYSRHIFLHFYLNQRTENFLRGHERAFEAFGGVPRVLLYDNLKSAVLEREGDAIRFNPTLLAFSAHYCFEPRPVAVYRGNEKGRVERAIRYIRDNFFAARSFQTIEELNEQATKWCLTQAFNRPCPEDKTRSVGSVFTEEKERLITLPDNPFPCDEVEQVSCGKTPYVRFDLNDYSVPHTYTRKTLTVQASLSTVKIMDGSELIAEHPRSYDKSLQIENEEHIQKLIGQKRQASQHRGQDRIVHAIDCGQAFLTAAAGKGYVLKSTCKQLNSLLDDYGAAALDTAMQAALKSESPHPNTVRLHLEQPMGSQQPKIKVTMNNQKARAVTIRPHDLADYKIFNQQEELSDE